MKRRKEKSETMLQFGKEKIKNDTGRKFAEKGYFDRNVGTFISLLVLREIDSTMKKKNMFFETRSFSQNSNCRVAVLLEFSRFRELSTVVWAEILL